MALVTRFPSLGDMTVKRERTEASNKIFPKVVENKNKKVNYKGTYIFFSELFLHMFRMT